MQFVWWKKCDCDVSCDMKVFYVICLLLWLSACLDLRWVWENHRWSIVISVKLPWFQVNMHQVVIDLSLEKNSIGIWYVAFDFLSLFLWLRCDCGRGVTSIRVLRNYRLLKTSIFHVIAIEDRLRLRLHLTTIRCNIRIEVIMGLQF